MASRGGRAPYVLPMLVVVDAGAFIENDWHASSPAASALFSAASRGIVTVAVPEVVLREVINKHREQEQAAIRDWEKAQRQLRRLQAARCSVALDPSPPAANAGYEADLRTKLERARVRIPPLPPV